MNDTLHYTTNQQGHLTIAGLDAVQLAKDFGTPVVVYDIGLVRERARKFKDTFTKQNVKAQVAYASKAFSSIAIYEVMKEEGLSLDVVSAGELYTAIQAQFPVEKIHFHGNNKSLEELIMAFDYKIGCIVVDNFYELELVKQLAEERKQDMAILLRVTPGIEAHTHTYITTGQQDSKFGFDLNNGQADDAFKLVAHHPYVQLLGLHCHIGSQIFETQGFVAAAEKLLMKMQNWSELQNYTCTVLNLGGGFGIRYTEEDSPLPPEKYVEEMIKAIQRLSSESAYQMPEIWIEPGRSLVGDAGTTLYTIGSQKVIPDTRHYIAVDGGMSDNIRPALYQARYDARVANRMNAEADQLVTVAGKCCESGDKLIEDISLPPVEAGDILAVFATGAYGYAMASNYNRLTRPAVVFVEDGQAQVVIRRESLADLIRNDLSLYKEESQG
ncbi:diaminopimelate decarboxylase [Chryseomicrobium sp. FSL W7-1435]|uniref:diaminopimelate decarboxylase n=1 Tax=Chryseomicrobium sp. FSL W7-1435 TaxID=2921704 RepID=UPI00315B174B